jgi:DNA-binding SARP family transcriptional activator
MDFRLLGPLEVSERGRSLALGGIKQRSLLAVLLLHANELVSHDRLTDQLWGAGPPATAAKSIQVYVSRLRKVLGDGRLATHAPGYLLRVQPSELDLARFEHLAGQARRATPESAARKLREALALWRGPALADLAYEAFAQVEIARLVEMRLAVLEQRIDADLGFGRHAELVAELEALVTRYPLREWLRCQLMLALYRSARQAEALHVYRAARRELSEELGLEPSKELKRLEQAVLRQDPGLDLPEGAPGAAGAGSRSSVAGGAGRRPRAARCPAGARRPRHVASSCGATCGIASAARGDRRRGRPRRRARGRGSGADGPSGGAAGPRDRRPDGRVLAPSRGDDIARLAAQVNVDLLLMDAAPSPLDGDALVVLEQAPCDVALLAEAGGSLREGPVIVPFGAGGHDWAALELGAWVARAADVPLRLIGATDRREDGRDASRLLADASLIVQRAVGIVAEPLLASPGRRGIAALAEGAGLLVVGLSERWRREGFGRARGELAEAPPAPAVFVRSGTRPGGLAPAESRTRFSWSLTQATG